MVKRLIGVLVVFAVAVIIVIAAINRDSFRSLVERDMILNDVQPAELPVEPWSPEVRPATAADSLGAVEPLERDSVTAVR